MNVLDRFIKYVRISTPSSADNSAQNLVPSSNCQLILTGELYSEMLEMGLTNVYADEHSYVYGTLPASKGYENVKAVMFNAHIDTVPDFPGININPQIICNYNGEPVELGNSGRILSPEMFPDLIELKGHTLITTDGTTVLGADDKAGIAEILTAVATIIEEKIPHGRVEICFSPDEEIGHGAALLDLERVNAGLGFTVDGGEPFELNYETFNAAGATWIINGVSVHPGYAKNTMINAALVALEINSMLPSSEIPALTEGYEGYFHLIEISGTVEKAEMSYLIREHDEGSFEDRKRMLRHIEKSINEKYGSGTAILTISDTYKNMGSVINKKPEIIDVARKAIINAGMEPLIVPVRGGTDGSQLTFRGLPCPNIGTGGYCCHGPFEHISLEKMNQVVNVIMNIVSLLAEE